VGQERGVQEGQGDGNDSGHAKHVQRCEHASVIAFWCDVSKGFVARARRLEITYRSPNYWSARWKVGKLPLHRVPATFSGLSTVTFDLSAPPVASTLVLRVAVGRQNMREVAKC
jgi:hypothetical protein